jgi:hypothetical protein
LPAAVQFDEKRSSVNPGGNPTLDEGRALPENLPRFSLYERELGHK